MLFRSNVAAGRSVVVWEMELSNVAGDPDHCPPAVAWIMQLDGGRVSELRLHHSKPLLDFSAPVLES